MHHAVQCVPRQSFLQLAAHWCLGGLPVARWPGDGAGPAGPFLRAAYTRPSAAFTVTPVPVLPGRRGAWLCIVHFARRYCDCSVSRDCQFALAQRGGDGGGSCWLVVTQCSRVRALRFVSSSSFG
ncbi:hypothetical protein D1007_29996 [Hordeum vulgare]|nr:hypothetical protein D1007_29996 [Hordeum vulgare]